MAEDARTALEEIAGLMKRSCSDAAELKCRQALARWEDDVNVTAMLGAILASTGKTEEAEKLLRVAIRMEPAFAKPYEDLGALQLARNDTEGAIHSLRKALALNPGQSSVIQSLCVALHRAGRSEEARIVRDRQRRSLPIPTLLLEADALRANGEITESEGVCDIVLRRAPDNTDALRILAKAATDDGRFVVAEGYLKRIAKLSGNHPDALFDLGKFLHDRCRYPEALTALQAAARLSADNPEIQSLLGHVFGILGHTRDALLAYERCLALRPGDPAALIGRGHMLRIAGLKDEARESYAACTRVRPEIGSAWWYLASLHRYVASDDDILVMQNQLGAGSVNADSEVEFRFALARAFENRGQYEAAWNQYSLGNSAKRKSIVYDSARFELENERIKDTFSRSMLSGRAANTANAPSRPTPIFILGVPRSGSTLIEQILASHSQIEGCGELPTILTLTSSIAAKKTGNLHYTEVIDRLSADELTDLGENYLRDAAARCGKGCQYFTDKMPANFPHIGLIQRILPHARIIDARRHPVAACVANYRQLFAQGKYQSYDLTELGEYYLRYIDIMDHWDDVLPGKVLRVQYEDVVADLDSQVRRILDFCGVPFESSCIEFHKTQRAVNTASAEQVRQPIYATAVEFWKNYDPYIGQLREVLAPVL